MQDENTLRRWVQNLVKKERKNMEPSDIAYFLNKVGTDMENILREMEKLVCYAMDRDVPYKGGCGCCVRHADHKPYF